ncbi:vWA domain-containing protein [Granulicoccus sp. GXG6511]|uniref:vWA domain-containing protein n=1 Tax=Granulicoccus sp. GXG6511 TaxID=3381351 RepID=UPI003D7CDA1F
MRTTFTTAVRAVLAGLLLGVGGVVLGLAQATPAQAAETAADNYVACLNGSKRGDLLILIDTSASLQASDAEAARIKAGEYLLRRLAKSADDGKLTLNVSLAGFANRYEPGTQWSELNPGSVDRVLGDIRDYQNRNAGQGTDYWLGLDGARRALSDRKQAAPDACQGIVFFSDGSLDIDRAPDEDQNPIDRPYAPDNPLRTQADRDAAKAAATESMCRRGGLADQVRVVPITLFGVGLTAAGTQASDFDLMRRVVEGGCGEEPANGQFALAQDIDSMLQAFDRIAGEGTRQEGRYCQDEQAQLCEEGAHSFVLDASINSVSVLGSGDIDEPRIVLVGPRDQQLELRQSPLGEPQQAQVEGVAVSWTWMSQKTFSATLDSAGHNDVWTGRWRLIFFDPTGANPQARSRTSIHISGNVFPVWPDAQRAEVRAGESTPVTFGLENADKQPIQPDQLLGQAAMDVTLIDADGNEHPIARGLGRDAITTPQQLNATQLKPGPASVRLALRVTTAGWDDPRTGERVPGTELRPQLSDIPFTVLAPVGFGRVDPSVHFGTVEGPVNLSAALPAHGPGCVWLDSTTAPEIRTGPAEITGVTIASSANSAETCLRVADGASQDLPLTLTSEQTGSGGLTGTFVVKMASLDAPDRVQDFTVDYGAEIRRPLNKANFILTLIAALLLGPGIPLALLYLLKRATAKIPARPLLTQAVPLQVDGSRLSRDGAPFALRDGDLRTMAQIPSGGARVVDLGGIQLRTRTGKSPFGAGDVLVMAGQHVGASSADAQPVGSDHRARLPLAVHNNWVLLHDPAGPANAATALLLVAGDGTPQERQKLVDDLNRRGPQVFSTLRALRAGGDHPGSPGGGGAPDGGNPFGGAPRQGGESVGTNPFGSGPAHQGPQWSSAQGQQHPPAQGQHHRPTHGQHPPAPQPPGQGQNPFGQNPFT